MIRFTRMGPNKWAYWGTLHQDPVGDSRLQQFWFRLDDPPYWVGNGNRLRFRKDLWLHIGWATQVDSHEEVLGGRVLLFTPREVGDWGAEEETEAGDTGGIERTPSEHL